MNAIYLIRHGQASFAAEEYDELSALGQDPRQGFQELFAKAVARSQTALVFTSGGAISVAVRQLLGLRDEQALRLNWTIVNASITKLLSGSSGPRLSTLNEHGYLEGLVSDEGSRLITYR